MTVSSTLQAIIPPSSVPEPGATATLKLLPLSDLHLPSCPEPTEILLANQEYLQSMDFVVLLGDQCACYGTDAEYETLNNFIQNLHRPYTAINGNHEFYFEIYEETSKRYGHVWDEQSVEAKASQLLKFRSYFGFDSLWRAEQNGLGSFIFLGIDDIENSKAEGLSSAQLSFLENQLQASDSVPVYIFCHVPLMLSQRLDMEYYDAERTACAEPEGELRELIAGRKAPLFWMSGHIHLHPDHYMFPAYQLAANVWQVHCPDSWGFSRWLREHRVPQRHQGLFSRHLEISRDCVTLVTHDHCRRLDLGRQTINFDKIETANAMAGRFGN